MLSLSVTLIGVFVLPVLDLIGLPTASKLFGLAALLLAGYAFALAGHYEMYNPNSGRSMTYFPFQERIAVIGIALAVVAYAAVAVSK
jgi:hypothetical protein